MSNGWIGFDLDGTLAKYNGWQGNCYIGEPIAPMINKLHSYLSMGQECRIFTARAASTNPDRVAAIATIEQWSLLHIGMIIPITAEKDFNMIDLYDDRCHHVEANTGRIIG